MRHFIHLAVVGALLVAPSGSTGAPADGWDCLQVADRLVISYAGRSVADYVFRDERILRPYLANIRTPDGIQVTRNHPPVTGMDADDHDTMHPGIWLAFGDINGSDFWRNKGRIEHVRFAEPPTVQNDRFVPSPTAWNSAPREQGGSWLGRPPFARIGGISSSATRRRWALARGSPPVSPR